HCAIESIEKVEDFNCTHLLPFAFDSLDSVNKPLQPNEFMFFKFARSFALFMDALNGFDTSTLKCNDPKGHILPFIPKSFRPELAKKKKLDRAPNGYGTFKRPRLCPEQQDRLMSVPDPSPPSPIVPKTEDLDETTGQLDEPEQMVGEIKEEIEETLKVWNDIEDRINAMQGPIDAQPGSSRDEIKKEEEEY
ncbi:hypothetical protein PFISCL1PPCAC_27826, partial [Pristionchus fissidentatus]